METDSLLATESVTRSSGPGAIDSQSVKRRKLKVRGHARVANKQSFLRKIVSTEAYRKKTFGTIWVIFDYFAFAWLYGTVGPSLPDLQDIVDVDLQAASWIFTCFSLGYMTGCALHGFLYGHVNNLLLLALYASISGLMWVATPWCNYYWLMLLVRYIGGTAWGATDSGTHSQLFEVWGAEAGPFSELLYLTLGLGGMASTFALKPFLETPLDSISANNATLTTALPDTTMATSEPYGSTLFSNATSAAVTGTTTTRIQWAYLIAGAVSVLASLPFFVSYFAGKCSGKEAVFEDHTIHTSKASGRSRAVFLTAMVLLSIIHMIMTGIIDTYAGFITTFTIRHLGWSKQDGAFAATAFYIAIAAGNLVGMLLSLVMRTKTLFICAAICGVLSLAGLLVSGIYVLDIGIWVFDAACGFFLAPLWPAFFTYVEESVTPIAGTVASIFLFLGAAGMSLNPLIIGYTMGSYTPMWFTYIMVGECTLLTILTAIVMYMYREGKNIYIHI